MGYVILAIGAAGMLAGTYAQARSLGVTGAVVQMVSHGLITGALFLLTGVLHDRAGTYAIDAYSGLATPSPRFAAATAVASKMSEAGHACISHRVATAAPRPVMIRGTARRRRIRR